VTSAFTILRVMGALLYETRVRVLSCVIIIAIEQYCSRLGGANKVSVNFDTERYRLGTVTDMLQKQRVVFNKLTEVVLIDRTHYFTTSRRQGHFAIWSS
jgi:hypothetical protein